MVGTKARNDTVDTRRPRSRSLPAFCRRVALAGLMAGVAVATGTTGAQLPALRAPGSEAGLPSSQEVAAVRRHISQAWAPLTRTIAGLERALPDPKFPSAGDLAWPLYVARSEDRAGVDRLLTSALGTWGRRRVDLRVLPQAPADFEQQGLLFLPHPYVVPGGRFNEMYGWDSHFIVLGLLQDGQVELARDMADNHLYQVRHYGKVLNANRTYYLTRSQPPFLSRTVLAVFDRTRDVEWLRQAVPALEAYHDFWTRGPRALPTLGLSRYHDEGEGPAPEVVAAELDAQGLTHYDRVRAYYRAHEVADYPEADYYDAATDSLTALFYRADRAMRESGFDPSDRFGRFGADVLKYAPVCLNSLLFAFEEDLGRIQRRLGDLESAARWTARARERRAAIDRYLWDDQAGLYFDYNVATGRRRPYEFATTFFPLWVGAASPEQARRVADRLSVFEAPGGLLTSTRETGQQWDAPYGWAPLQLAAVEGLRRYGYDEAADRLSCRFIALVTKEFTEHGVILEKYDVRRRESDVSTGLRFGYASNEVGFGWTNAVYLQLLDGLRLP